MRCFIARATPQPNCPGGIRFEDYADEHTAIEEQLKALGLPLPDSDCMPTTDELSAVMVDQIKRLRKRATLTANERKAIRRAAAIAKEMHDSRLQAVLGALLERLS